MSRTSQIRFALCTAVLAAGFAWGLLRQWQQQRLLQIEHWQMQREAEEVRQLEAENRRLRASQIPMADLERLRAERVALPRLREELADLRKRSRSRSP